MTTLDDIFFEAEEINGTIPGKCRKVILFLRSKIARKHGVLYWRPTRRADWRTDWRTRLLGRENIN